MKIIKYLFLIALSLAVLSLNFSSLRASGSYEELVKSFAANITAKAIEIRNTIPKKEDRQAKLIKLFDENVDTKVMAGFVLGKNIKDLSEEKKQKYYQVYKQYVIYNYIPQFLDYDAGSFEVYAVKEIKEGTYLAKVNVRPKKEKIDTKLDYRIIKNKEGNLKITDFIGEGVSLILTQKNDFNEVINSKGVDYFLSFLENKVKELKK